MSCTNAGEGLMVFCCFFMISNMLNNISFFQATRRQIENVFHLVYLPLGAFPCMNLCSSCHPNTHALENFHLMEKLWQPSSLGATPPSSNAMGVHSEKKKSLFLLCFSRVATYFLIIHTGIFIIPGFSVRPQRIRTSTATFSSHCSFL